MIFRGIKEMMKDVFIEFCAYKVKLSPCHITIPSLVTL